MNHPHLREALKIIDEKELADAYSQGWQNARATIIKTLAEDDARTLTEAYKNMPVQINLNDPSLPVTKHK
jgi:hypothetical protein